MVDFAMSTGFSGGFPVFGYGQVRELWYLTCSLPLEMPSDLYAVCIRHWSQIRHCPAQERKVFSNDEDASCIAEES